MCRAFVVMKGYLVNTLILVNNENMHGSFIKLTQWPLETGNVLKLFIMIWLINPSHKGNKIFPATASHTISIFSVVPFTNMV